MPTETLSQRVTERKSCDSSLPDRQLDAFTAPSLSRIACVVLLGSLFFMNLPLPAAAQWVAPNFLVAPIDPWQNVPLNNGNRHSFPSINWQQQRKNQTGKATYAEAALVESGILYWQAGLLEPDFSPMAGDSFTRGVFLFRFPGTANLTESSGEYISEKCDEEQRFQKDWLALDDALSSYDLYETSAHELFHTIQARYLFSQSSTGDKACKLPKWIVEGTADAAGYFLLEKKFGKEIIRTPGAYGKRPYDVPLYEHDAWKKPTILNRFGYTSTTEDKKAAMTEFSYHTNSFWRFLMDRWGDLNEYDHNRFQALSDPFMKKKGVPLSKPDLPLKHEAWLRDWLVPGIEENWGVFSHLYGEFLTEFAAWPGSKYPDIKNSEKWLEDGFGGCTKVSLHWKKQNKTSKTISLKPHSGMDKALYAVSGRCIQVTVKTPKTTALELELGATTSNPLYANQLLLGLAREEHGTGNQKRLVRDCYSHARRDGFASGVNCLFLGNVKKIMWKSNKVGHTRTFRFEPQIFETATPITFTFILTNVDAVDPSLTVPINELELTIGLHGFDGKTDKSTQFAPPNPLTLNMIPDLSIPKRQQLYGIKKNSGFGVLNPVNMGTFQVNALDESGNKTESYTIMAMERVAFGQTGRFRAVVSSKSGDTNALCQLDDDSVGNILRSDDEVLTFTIDTPICKFSMDNIAACQNGCPIVDHFEGELSLPFGYRYFSENKIEDVVTPGVLLDIDRYHHNVFGTPLQGLGDGGSEGPGTSESDGPGFTLDVNGGRSSGGPVKLPSCDCSCVNYTQLNEAYDDITAPKDSLPDLNAALQIAQCRLKCRKPFRECRRAERQAQTHQ